MRTLKGGRPFMLMESTPTFSNWQAVWKLKKPGMHAASSLLAVAHGSDTVQYFQWRKSRGGMEKFHGASSAMTARDSNPGVRRGRRSGTGAGGLDGVVGTRVPAQAAIIYDWENRWALEGAGVVPGNGEERLRTGSCKRHHDRSGPRAWPVDVIDMEQDFSPYRLVVAPMLYMIRPGVAERLEGFVRAGRHPRDDLLVGDRRRARPVLPSGPWPAAGAVLGLGSEEVDGPVPGESNRLVPAPGNGLGLRGSYEAVGSCCELVRAESARVLATYGGTSTRGAPRSPSTPSGLDWPTTSPRTARSVSCRICMPR